MQKISFFFRINHIFIHNLKKKKIKIKTVDIL